ncbi:MAG: D-hexose-6-phosphate mutarotase [Sheuella sp.]|nr:D-hexose-6-phosphate mutarotase [Sheuella sp.]
MSCFEQFARGNNITFEQLDNGIVLVKIDNSLATATVSLYGGHIVEWQPKSQQAPVLWRSERVQYKPGKAIRAGVPICWPWFGAHPSDTHAPSHGYARINAWDITSVLASDAGATEICMTLRDSQSTDSLPYITASLSVRISIGEVLSIDLTTTNIGSDVLKFTEALHAYFYVSDVAQVEINGLSECDYVDLIDNNTIKSQVGAISFSGELGRVYLKTISDCLINDPVLLRTIRIAKTGSQSTVVWNPSIDTATKMDDLGPLGWRTMVCVESANALTDTVCIEPGQQHTLSVTYSVE